MIHLWSFNLGVFISMTLSFVALQIPSERIGITVGVRNPLPYVLDQ